MPKKPQNDDIVKKLLKTSDFQERIAEYFHTPKTKQFSVSPLGDGLSKTAYTVQDRDSGNEFVVKEIRFDGQHAEDDIEIDKNDTLSPKEAFFELSTIREIARDRNEGRYFPKHISTFAYIHPEYDSYTHDKLGGGEFVSLQQARRLMKDGWGASLFIAEELIKGRDANAAEVAQAEEIRRQGMERCPRIWLAVDTVSNDVIVRDDGSLVFIDVGNFKDYSPQEKQMLKKFMTEGRKKS